MLRQMHCNFSRNVRFPFVDLANDLEHAFRSHALEQITASTCLQGALDFHIALERCQHNDPSFREFSPYGGERVYATHIGKSQIEQGYVRKVLPELGDRLTP